MATEEPFNYTETSLGNFFNLSNTATEATSVNETFKWTSAEIARLIQIIFRPILITVGTVGNVLAIYIMRKTSLKHFSCCFLHGGFGCSRFK